MFLYLPLLEIQCINEEEMYLKLLIHEIGIKLHSTAHCTGIQCIRHACFNIDHALLRKHWTLQNVVTNLEECMQMLEAHKYITKQEHSELVPPQPTDNTKKEYDKSCIENV